jgi:hypothetical protein
MTPICGFGAEKSLPEIKNSPAQWRGQEDEPQEEEFVRGVSLR